MARIHRGKRKGVVAKDIRRRRRRMGPAIAAAALGAFAMTAQTAGSAARASIAPPERDGVARTYRIPAGTVASALTELADQNGMHVLYPAGATRGMRTPGLAGRHSLPQALDLLLSGTGLAYRLDENGRTVSIVLAQAETGRHSDVGVAQELPPIDVGAERRAAQTKDVSTPGTTILGEEDLARPKATAVDTTELLKQVPGVSLYTGGGVSNLPVIRGLADDRLNILVDGVNVTSACENHMNPPLSYIDPSRIGKIEVFSGVTPVSKGGDSIGGSIIVEPPAPLFSERKGEYTVSGRVGAFYRSNVDSPGVNATVRAGTDDVAIDYSFAYSKARSYRRGKGGSPFDPSLWELDAANNYLRFLGDGAVLDGSLWEATRHSGRLAFKTDNGLLSFDMAGHHIPYQGFPNLPMDMTLNNSLQGGGRYQGVFDWGSLDARVYYQRTNHEMDNLLERSRNPRTHMLMKDLGVDFGYRLKAEIPLDERNLLRVGNEYHQFRLENWYPNVTPWYRMPLEFLSVHEGRRERVGTYAELQTVWTGEWTSLLGMRNDVVWMNAGPVNGYRNNAYDKLFAIPFNAADRARTDVNFDATASIRYTPTSWSAYELGFARKTRSPNLFERYSWWDHNTMVGWAGDSNGYAGNLDLKPEVAYHVAFSAEWRDPDGDDWSLKVSPYYTYVDQFIWARAERYFVPDARILGLQYVNIDRAELYGVDLSGRYAFLRGSPIGDLTLRGNLNFVRGTYVDRGRGRPCPAVGTSVDFFCGPTDWPVAGMQVQSSGSLYHIMPLNGRIALEHSIGDFSSAAELQLVASKTYVSVNHGEPRTPGYALLNLRAGYRFDKFRIDAGIDNVFDTLYYPPLGGVAADETFRTNPVAKRLVPGMGRSAYIGLTVEF
ncbi:MAG: TonB-dependent receptor [Methylocystaceae bacterium]|nr:MAG: TonB-dependent receptor [Methylocystaceae bacterium]